MDTKWKRKEYLSEYGAWNNARQRCTNPNHPANKDYLARGIVMEPCLAASFSAFMDYLGPKPDASLTLERINNDLGYVRGNLEWASRSRQVKNRRTYTRKNPATVTHNGETLTIYEWACKLGMKASTIRNRYNRGLSSSRILSSERLPRKR